MYMYMYKYIDALFQPSQTVKDLAWNLSKR